MRIEVHRALHGTRVFRGGQNLSVARSAICSMFIMHANRNWEPAQLVAGIADPGFVQAVAQQSAKTVLP